MPARSKELSSLRSLLPKVLADVAQKSGCAFPLSPLWSEVAGPQLSRAARPARVEGNVLVLSVQNPTWGDRVSDLQSELCERLSQLGAGTVRGLRCEVRR